MTGSHITRLPLIATPLPYTFFWTKTNHHNVSHSQRHSFALSHTLVHIFWYHLVSILYQIRWIKINAAFVHYHQERALTNASVRNYLLPSMDRPLTSKFDSFVLWPLLSIQTDLSLLSTPHSAMFLGWTRHNFLLILDCCPKWWRRVLLLHSETRMMRWRMRKLAAHLHDFYSE